jgi:uncharacterized protein (TIGR03067 family)
LEECIPMSKEDRWLPALALLGCSLACVIGNATGPGLALAGGPPLPGNWTLKSIQTQEDSFSSNIDVSITATHIVFDLAAGPIAQVTMRYTLNPRGEQIDVLERGGHCTKKGIYRLRGDLLMLCFTDGDRSRRPREVTTFSDGRPQWLLTLSRAKARSLPPD